MSTKGFKIQIALFALLIIVGAMLGAQAYIDLQLNTSFKQRLAVIAPHISEQQEELLSRNFKKVYIAFDSDKAGLQGTIKYGHYLSLHLSVYIITLKKNTDPDNYSKKEFCRLYRKAVPFQEYISKKLLNRFIV